MNETEIKMEKLMHVNTFLNETTFLLCQLNTKLILNLIMYIFLPKATQTIINKCKNLFIKTNESKTHKIQEERN